MPLTREVLDETRREVSPCIGDFIGEARAFAEGIEPTVVETDRVNLMTLHGAKGLEVQDSLHHWRGGGPYTATQGGYVS